MAIIKPFAALRPSKEKAGQVSAQPFDSGSRELATIELTENPYSFLHVVKPYLHFKGEKKNPEKHFPLGLAHLQKLKQEGAMVKETQPAFYIYRVIIGSQAYTGIIAAASVDDYMNGNILKHENTLTEKQNEIASHIHFFNSLGNPVLLTYPDDDSIDKLIHQYILNHVPEYNFISADQKKHNLWVVKDENDITLIEERFALISHLYIADGHHRSAGSAAYADMIRAERPGSDADETFNYFPVCLIPFSKLTIFEYHRLVKDKARVNQAGFIELLKQSFNVIPSGNLPIQPLSKGEFGVYIKGKAFLLTLKEELLHELNSTLNKLDVSVVEEYILRRIFQITDSKTDNRLAFIDGARGIGHLQEAVDSGEFDLAISLFPTSIQEVKQVADEQLIMPPKSTWIEPKIRTGLIVLEHNLGEKVGQ